MKHHYVYRITNLIMKMHYYGVRTCKTDPSIDIGKVYFSSSTDKEFMLDQKENPKNYKYKVIKIFKTRGEAGDLEIKLHNKLNVSLNKAFYNKANSTSERFTIEGFIHSDETKQKIRESKIGKCGPNKGKSFSIDHKANMSIAQRRRTDDRSLSEETKNKIGNANKGRVQSEETRRKRSASLIGLKQSEETRRKRSASLIGRTFSSDSLEKMRKPQIKIICIHCSKEGGQSAMKRYHFDNCKLKVDNVSFKNREQS